eukprot:gene7005-7790_t
MADSKNSVKVFIRIRPTASFASENLELQQNEKSITVHCKTDERRGYINNQVLDWKFSFDGILHNISQEEVYKKCSSNLVTKSLDGYNSTLFAYGETGAGKTFTMTGTKDFRHRGIIPRSLTQLYKEIKERTEQDITVRISYMQIYKDKMYDLLNSNDMSGSPRSGSYGGYSDQMTVTEDDNGYTYVKGLSCHLASTEEEALNLLFEGEANRIISNHQLNRYSSRSHCIFTVFIDSRSHTLSNTSYTLSKLNLVDLAGSERIGKTKAEGKTQEEALHINKSLTFLEQVIIALADHKRDHIPFRQSKLTHVLQDSLGGKCHTVMIGNIWGEKSQLEETLSTLRFGNRVMLVRNEPSVNTVYDPFKICKALEKEISDLHKELSMYDTLTNRRQISYEPLSETQVREIKSQVREFVDGQIQDIEIINIRQVKEVFEQFKTLVKKAEESKIEEQDKREVSMQEKAQTPSKGARGGKNETVNATITDDSILVGETDGQSFGVGVAPNSAKMHQPSSIVNSKKSKTRKVKPDSGGETKRSPTPPENTKTTQQQYDDTQRKSSAPAVQAATANRQPTSPTRPRTPPPKGEAFEQFKTERGERLNNVLTENKEILKSKKIEAKEVVNEINSMKKELDNCKEELDLKKRTQEDVEEEDAEIEGKKILDEEEYTLVKKISELKSKYRVQHEMLQNLRSDITYCEKIVNQCRQRLLTEFNAWYADCFMPSDEDRGDDRKSIDSIKGGKTARIIEDEQEKFERLQMEIMMENPESVPFYSAKLQTERKLLYTDGNKRRKPGDVVPKIRDKPPTSLTVK